MHYADIKKLDVANGPGVRTTLFVSGCTHHCKGCFNPETWDFNYGKEFTEETINEIIEDLKPSHVKGLTLLGGEPFEPVNQQALLPLVRKVRELYPEKTIWAFTGYLFDEEIVGKMFKNDYTRELISMIDVLIDGPFVEELKDLSLRFKGSFNQRTIDIPKTLQNVKNNNGDYSLDKNDVVLLF